MKPLLRAAVLTTATAMIALSSLGASQARDPAYAYTGDPAYRGSSYRGSSGYEAYAYAPAPRYGYRRGARIETQSAPRHLDPGAGYNSNTLAPGQDWKYQGHDY